MSCAGQGVAKTMERGAIPNDPRWVGSAVIAKGIAAARPELVPIWPRIHLRQAWTTRRLRRRSYPE